MESTIEQARREFDTLVREIRPELHRFCARMTGSVIDGEDVVQDTLAKAFYLLPQTRQISNLRGWLFRIAHNKAIDLTRSHVRRFSEPLEDHNGLVAEVDPISQTQLARMGLALFMRLTPVQRGAVILKDVLDHSLEEISEILDATIGSVKGALHRGRATLHRLAKDSTPQPTALDPSEAAKLEDYVRHFAARDFDQLRLLLAQDVRLDVVGIAQAHGKSQVGEYFHRYGGTDSWHPHLGWIEGQPAILVYATPDKTGDPVYFILIRWNGNQVYEIKDFRYSRYVMNDAEWSS